MRAVPPPSARAAFMMVVMGMTLATRAQRAAVITKIATAPATASCPVAGGAECQPCPSEHGRFVGCPGKKGLRIEVNCGGRVYPSASVHWENRTWVECHATSQERELERGRGATQVLVFMVVALVLCFMSAGYLVKRRRERFSEIIAYSRV